MKYIIINDEQFGLEVPIIFPNYIQHDQMASSLAHRGKVISAGFVRIMSKDEVYAAGKSISLNLPSRPEDAKIIQDALNFS